jgi:hypothetical protein
MTVCNSTLRVNLERRGNPNPSLCACVFVRELDGETIASLLAAATEHCASPLGFHARAKPMGFDAALVPGTIGGLTHGRLQMTVRTTLRCRPVKLFEACGWGKLLVRGPWSVEVVARSECVAPNRVGLHWNADVAEADERGADPLRGTQPTPRAGSRKRQAFRGGDATDSARHAERIRTSLPFQFPCSSASPIQSKPIRRPGIESR